MKLTREQIENYRKLLTAHADYPGINALCDAALQVEAMREELANLRKAWGLYSNENFAMREAIGIEGHAVDSLRAAPSLTGHIGTRWEISAAGNMVTLVFDTLTNMENYLAKLREQEREGKAPKC